MDAIDELWWQGDLRAAYRMSRDRMKLPSGAPFRGGGDALDDAARWHAHGTRAWHLAHYEEAGELLSAAYQVRRSVLGDGDSLTLATLERLAAHADFTDQSDLAKQRFEQVVMQRSALDGPDSVAVAIAQRNYASFARTRGDAELARRLLQQAERVFKRQVPDDDPEYLALRKSRAILQWTQKEPMAAARTIEDALHATRLPHDHPFVAGAYLTLARAALTLGNPAWAQTLILDVIARFELGYGNHPLLAIAHQVSAEIYLELDNVEAAQTAARQWKAIYGAFYPPTAFHNVVATISLFARCNLVDEAAALAQEMELADYEQAHACFIALANRYLRHADARGLPWLDRAAAVAPAAEKAKLEDTAAGWRRRFGRGKVKP